MLLTGDRSDSGEWSERSDGDGNEGMNVSTADGSRYGSDDMNISTIDASRYADRYGSDGTDAAGNRYTLDYKCGNLLEAVKKVLSY